MQIRATAFAAVLLGACSLAACHREESAATAARQTGAAQPSEAAAAAAGGADVHGVDRIVLAWLETHSAAVGDDELRDALPGERFRLRASRAPRLAVWQTLTIDLDRDGKDDEKWLLDEGRPAKRRVSTKDDGNYDREDRWRDGRWVRKRGAW